ncbi:hypothetical protein GPECTOR_8g240 [Gonium pectorale]|uniref:ATP-dependent Clp protease proteolytic subunit n=1 Tax=Gonium pectorale TaxID=33097 RepID=A0A150GSK7_GONPE|nr:hypothetical protein GPECTOR_8g240 [Gonium pectorale]|eukprot:KXZ52859.1 hypothetical protein GPECTOR_8g240 [Gonium pectorale]
MITGHGHGPSHSGPELGLHGALRRGYGPHEGLLGFSRVGSVHGAAGWSPHSAAGIRLGALSAGAGHGVVCCVPGACEALVAMGLGNRLAGVGADCDYPPDVCSKHRVVFGWAAPEEAPQGAAARGIRVIHPVAGSTPNLSGMAAGMPASAPGASARGCRPSVDRAVARGCGRVLLLDELALRQEAPAVLVLPDPAELSNGEQSQLEQALVETGMVNPGGPSVIMHASCHSLVDVMDLILELGSAVGEPHAASMLLERLQARLRRVQAAAAGAVLRPGVFGATLATGSLLPPALSLPTGRCPRVLVLQSLQPMVEPGRLLKERIVVVNGAIDDGTSNSVIAQLLFLESQAPDKPITMYINSPGGVVTAGLAIYDTMQYIRCPISTLVVGQAASMASLLLTAGEKGQRRSLPHARIMLHQPLGAAEGQASDIMIRAREIVRMKETLTNLYIRHTGCSREMADKTLDRDSFMSAQEAKDWGLIDEILVERPATEVHT